MVQCSGYAHKDQGLNRTLIERCKAAGFDALALTVDAVVGGNGERDLRSRFTAPLRLTPRPGSHQEDTRSLGWQNGFCSNRSVARMSGATADWLV